MAEEKEAQETAPKKKGKLVPVLIGVFLVVGAAIGVVAVTAPAGTENKEPEKVDLDTLPAQRWGKHLLWTFNLSGPGLKSLGKLEISFVYRTESLEAARIAIENGWDKATSEGRLLLFDKTKNDLSTAAGVIELKEEIVRILQDAFFSEVEGKVSDVYILELIYQ